MTEPYTIEGEEISGFTASLPAATLEAPGAYPRGTYLTLEVKVRVKSWGVVPDRKGNLDRNHRLVMEECTITDVLTPTQRQALMDAVAAENDASDELGDYTVTEDPTLDDAVAAATEDPPVTNDFYEDDEPLADVVRAFRSGTKNAPPDEVDDDDSAHAWMDEDEEPGVHVDQEFLASAHF